MSERETARAGARAPRDRRGGFAAARARRGGLAAALALAAAWAAPALACPVCYGEASGGVMDGAKMSVAFLGGLVYLLLFGGVGMAVMVRRRALRAMDPRQGLRLIDGMAEDAMDGDDTVDDAMDRPAGPHPAAPEETSER